MIPFRAYAVRVLHKELKSSLISNTRWLSLSPIAAGRSSGYVHSNCCTATTRLSVVSPRTRVAHYYPCFQPCTDSHSRLVHYSYQGETTYTGCSALPPSYATKNETYPQLIVISPQSAIDGPGPLTSWRYR